MPNTCQDMQIKSFQIYQAKIQLKKPFITSLGPEPFSEHIFIKVTLENGVIGWGECAPSNTINGENTATAMALVPALAGSLIGNQVHAHHDNFKIMDKVIFGHYSIKSAFDLACYDAAARQNNLPLYQYLGGRLEREMITDYTVSLASVDAMADQAKELYQQGFRKIKVKLGGDPELDITRIKAIRAALGNEVELRVDANQGWSFEGAVTALKGMSQFAVAYCEEPINRKLAYRLKALQSQVPIDIMADESVVDHHDAHHLASVQNIKFFNLKIGKSGGITPILKIIEVAEKFDISMQVGGFIETKIVFTANCHLARCSPNIRFFDCDSPLFHDSMPTIGGMEYREDWTIDLPERAGLGIDLNEDFLAKCQQIQIG